MAVITLRVTDRIHDQIRAAAKAERVSMNQFCVLAINTAVTTLDADTRNREGESRSDAATAKHTAERAARGQ
jgi:uncharacterized protein (DUF1778 family)